MIFEACKSAAQSDITSTGDACKMQCFAFTNNVCLQISRRNLKHRLSPLHSQGLALQPPNRFHLEPSRQWCKFQALPLPVVTQLCHHSSPFVGNPSGRTSHYLHTAHTHPTYLHTAHCTQRPYVPLSAHPRAPASSPALPVVVLLCSAMGSSKENKNVLVTHNLYVMHTALHCRDNPHLLSNQSSHTSHHWHIHVRKFQAVPQLRAGSSLALRAKKI